MTENKLVKYAAASFNTIMEQMTEMPQRKKPAVDERCCAYRNPSPFSKQNTEDGRPRSPENGSF